jgi:hypothetical protein
MRFSAAGDALFSSAVGEQDTSCGSITQNYYREKSSTLQTTVGYCCVRAATFFLTWPE